MCDCTAVKKNHQCILTNNDKMETFCCEATVQQRHITHDDLPLPVAPMMAFSPGFMIPLRKNAKTLHTVEPVRHSRQNNNITCQGETSTK